MSEHALVQQILIEFGSLPGMRIWRVNTGAAIRPGGGLVRFGLPGMADISGIIAGGQRIEVEAKTRTGKQRKEQVAWQKMIEGLGGLYILARTTDDVRRSLPEIAFTSPGFTGTTRPASSGSPETGRS